MSAGKTKTHICHVYSVKSYPIQIFSSYESDLLKLQQVFTVLNSHFCISCLFFLYEHSFVWYRLNGGAKELHNGNGVNHPTGIAEYDNEAQLGKQSPSFSLSCFV